MTIGPAPMMRMDLISVRFGMWDPDLGCPSGCGRRFQAGFDGGGVQLAFALISDCPCETGGLGYGLL
jgi:hypothetical protein